MISNLWVDLKRRLSRIATRVSTFASRRGLPHKMRTNYVLLAGTGSYDFLEPMQLESRAATASLLHELLNTRAFRRLAFIRFLGGIDYALVRSPNGAKTNVRYTRKQHSLGVGGLALYYAQRVGLAETEARDIFAAALLHDIGHAPFSHSLEPVFEQEFGLTHHKATEDIILGRVDIGRELHSVLKENRINIESVLELIAGRNEGQHGFFSGPINFDTIEAISRSRMYVGNTSNPLNPISVVEAAISRSNTGDQELVDAFWLRKNEVYKFIINSRTGVLADFACQHFMRSNLHRMRRDDYFTTEDVMFQKLPGLSQVLTNRSFETEVWHLVAEPIAYVLREFFVDAKYSFFSRDDGRRYKQIREHRELEARKPETVEVTKDLFDDHCLRSSEGVL